MKTKRLLSLDIMRGMTIVCMIIVNNGGGPQSYRHLGHSAWNGITVCDLVFPFFLFIMGVTTYISLAKTAFVPSAVSLRKIFRRTALIMLIGWAIHWFANVCYGKGWLDFGHLRLTGVLTRIALCYGVVSLMALFMSRKAMAVTAAVLLTVYGATLLLFNGYENDLSNVNAVVDRFLLPEGLLYTKRPVDPEGILGTVPAIAHTVIGFCCGALLMRKESLEVRLLKLFVVAALLLAGGFILSGILPENKRIWSPSYVLLTCGMAAALLATISYFTDVRGWRRGMAFFESFGVNPLFLYVLGDIAGIILGATHARPVIYDWILGWSAVPELASAIYAVTLM
ncbi:MAG: heparan-alpha-glucosaminide N-acetyltransferase domain-containing protein, partial [Muribaculaceae bacterium]|nr:heparan-alpha-glucosaminide N-acetyltransferase domain-containing protein [Muribaculaceae bacterium]